MELATHGLSLTILEQAPRLGGRCYSFTDEETGDTVDNGQHVLLGAYHSLWRYLDLIGTRRFVHPEPALALPLFLPERGRGWFRIASLPAPFHLLAAMLRFGLVPFRDRWNMVKVGVALQNLDREPDDDLRGMSVEEWLIGLGQSEEARRCLWYPIAISVMNEQPRHASAHLFARVLRAAFLGRRSDSAMLIPEVGQTELYVAGAEQLLRRRGALVRTSAEVQSLLCSGGEISGVRLGDGSQVQSRFVLSTIPPAALSRILPSDLGQRLPFERLGEFGVSPIVSIHLWFDRHFMADRLIGLIGGTLQWIFNRRKIVSGGDENRAYISGVISGARDAVDLGKEELVALALRDLESIYPEARDARLLRSIVLKEKRATFAPRSDVEGLRPRADTPVKNFFLAGDWTETGLPATIEGAVISGFRAAELIMAASRGHQGQR